MSPPDDRNESNTSTPQGQEPAPSGGHLPEAPPVKKSKAKRPRRWRRRILWASGIFVVLCIVLRVAMIFVLPKVLEAAAKSCNLSCTYDRLEITFLGLDAELWHLTVAPLEGGEPYLYTEYCRADLAVWPLFLGRLIVRRLEADGMDLFVERAADGSFPLLSRIRGKPPEKLPELEEPKPEEPEPEEKEPAENVSLRPPVAVQALRAQHIRLRVSDKSVSPPLEARVDFNLMLYGLGSSGRSVRLLLTVDADPVLDDLRLEGTISITEKELAGDFQLLLRRLHLMKLEGYLLPLGVRPVAEELSARASARLSARNSSARPGAAEFRLEVTGIDATADGRSFGSLDKFSVEASAVGPRGANLKEIALEGGKLQVERSSAGALRLAGIELAAAGPTGRPAPPEEEDAKPAAAPAPPPRRKASRPYPLVLDRMRWKDLQVVFHDEGLKPPVDLALKLEEFLAKDIMLDPGRPDAALEFNARLTSPGIAGEISAAGRAVPMAARKTFEANLRVEDIAPRALDPYLKPAGLETTLGSGKFSCSLRGSLESPTVGVTGLELALEELSFQDGEELFGMGGVRVSGAKLARDPGSIEVASVEISGPGFTVRREESGAFRAMGFRFQPTAQEAPAAERKEEPPGKPGAEQKEPAPALKPPQEKPRQEQPEDPQKLDPERERPGTGGAAGAGLPRLALSRFLWKDIKLRFIDERAQPATQVFLADGGIEISDLLLDLEGAPAEQPPAKLRAWGNAPGLAREITAAGSLTSAKGEAGLDLAIQGRGIAPDALAPYLRAAGLESTLEDGALDLKLGARASWAGATAGLSASLEALSFKDRSSELAGLDALRIRGVEMGPGGTRIEAVELEKPRARASRDAEGNLEFLGLRLKLGAGERKSAGATEDGRDAPASAPKPAAAAEGPPAGAATARADEAAKPASAQPTATVAAGSFSLGKFQISGAELRWADASLKPGFQTKAVLNSELQGLAIGGPEKPTVPASFSLSSSVEGLLEKLAVSGTLMADPRDLSLALETAATGIRGGGAAAYFPESFQPALEDGRFQVKVEVKVDPHEKGGRRARLTVSGLEYRDGAERPPFLQVESFQLAADRLDPEAAIFALRECSLAGLEVSARKTKDGSAEIMGFLLKPAAPKPEPPADGAGEPVGATEGNTAPAEEKPSVALTVPPSGVSTDPSSAAPPVPPAPAGVGASGKVAARLLRKLPLLSLEKLDLNLRRLSFADESKPASSPLVVSDVRLANPRPIQLLGEDPESQPPVELLLTGKVAPVMEAFKLEAQAVPFGAEPVLKLDVSLSGLRGKGITELLPDLEAFLDGTNLTDGRFQAKMEGALSANRRGPADFDFSSEFGGTVHIKDIEFKDGPDGPVLAGLKELDVEKIRINPATGATRIGSIEVTKPQLKVLKDKDGIHLLDLLVKLPEKKEEAKLESPDAKPESLAQPAPASTPAPATDPAPAPGPRRAPVAGGRAQVALDKLLLSELDFSLEDRTVDPPLIVPLTELEIDVRGLSTQLLSEERAVRFDVRLGAGKVPLTKPLDSAGGALFGVVGAASDAAALVSGGKIDDDGKREERELFQEISARGEVAIYPKLSGWVKASVSALELEGFKGPAGAAGVTLDGGTLDFGADVLFPKEFSVDASTRAVFTDMSVSEPPDGPIFRYLHLPAPLGAVIFALRDESGVVAVPLNLRLRKEGLTANDIAQVAIETLGILIGKAIAQAPIRVASGVGGVATGLGGLFGLVSGEEKPLEPAVLEFSPGDASLGESELNKLEPLIARLREDETTSLTLSHELGEEDIPRLRLLANPSREECLDMIARLRRRTAEELKRREALVAMLHEALGTSLDREADELLSKLKDLDRDLGLRERSLDQLYEMFRKGAERQAERRLREAGIHLGAERLAQARKALLEMAAPLSAESLKIERPRFKVAQAAPSITGTPGSQATQGAPEAVAAAGAAGDLGAPGAQGAASARKGRITVTLGAAKLRP